MDLTIEKILNQFPLRVAITDYCDLRCFFCSNEGMRLEERNTTHMQVNSFEFLIATTVKHGLRHVSITGGEPTLHPDLNNILRIVNSSKLEKAFFHTNGVGLTSDLINGPLKMFNKVALSIHATDYPTWHKITGGTENQFTQLWENIHTLGKAGYRQRLEIKYIPLRSINDSHDQIIGVLNLCARYNARFKFLILEPKEKAQMKIRVPLEEVVAMLISIGCKPLPPAPRFRGQYDYLPLNWYSYQNTKGIVIEIGCGNPDICQACYKANEIFVTPNLKIKACHVNPSTIPLEEAISKGDEMQILKAIVESRKFLYSRPGELALYWHQGG